MQVVHADGAGVVDALRAVVLGQHAAAAAQDVGQRQLVVGQKHLDAAHAGGQDLVQAGFQRVQAAAGAGAGQQDVRVKGHRAGLVALVVDGQAGDAAAAQLVQHLVGHGQLFRRGGVAGVGHAHQHVGKGGLLQRALEGVHQVVGQPADKADGVHQHHVQAAGQRQAAGGGVQRGKQHVRLKDPGPAQGVGQAGLAHVGVAHQRHHRHAAFLAGAAGLAPALFHLLQAAFQCLDAAADVPAVQLQLGLAGAAAGAGPAATAAALAAEHLAQALQPGHLVAQKRQLGLQFSLVGGGAGAEDLQDQHGAVNDLHLQGGAQIAQLAAGQLAVKNGGLGAGVQADQAGFGHLALAQHGGGLRRLAFLHHGGHRLHIVGLGQGGQLVQAAGGVKLSLVQRQQHHRDRPLRPCGGHGVGRRFGLPGGSHAGQMDQFTHTNSSKTPLSVCFRDFWGGRGCPARGRRALSPAVPPGCAAENRPGRAPACRRTCDRSRRGGR